MLQRILGRLSEMPDFVVGGTSNLVIGPGQPRYASIIDAMGMSRQIIGPLLFDCSSVASS
jgi:hypothetical protein